MRRSYSPQPPPPPSSPLQEVEERNVLGEVTKRWLGEQYLLNIGAASPDETPQIFDTLLSYGYAEPSVTNVTLEMDQDEMNDGRNPKVRYKLRLKWWRKFLLTFTRGESLLGKIFALLIAAVGAPLGIEKRVAERAGDYLPKKYNIRVEVV